MWRITSGALVLLCTVTCLGNDDVIDNEAGTHWAGGGAIRLDKANMYTVGSDQAVLGGGVTHERNAYCRDANDILINGGCNIYWRDEPEHQGAALVINHSSRPVDSGLYTDGSELVSHWECRARGWGPIEESTYATMQAVAVCLEVD